MDKALSAIKKYYDKLMRIYTWGEGVSFRLFELAPKSIKGKALMLWLDILVVNLLFFYLVKSFLLLPIGYGSVLEIIGLTVLFILAMLVLYPLEPFGQRPNRRGFIFRLAAFAAFFSFVGLMAGLSVVFKGLDYSFLRIEMIKFPLWWRLHWAVSPVSVIGLFAVASWLMMLALRRLRKQLLIVSIGLTGVLTIVVVKTFYVFGGPDFPFPFYKAVIIYFIYFCAPVVLFVGLLLFKSYANAFRVVPLAVHMLLIGLHYMGFVPFDPKYNPLIYLNTAPATYSQTSAVKMIYAPDDLETDSKFSFLRKMAADSENIFVNYGPTCGFMKIDKQSAEATILPQPGLVRDMKFDPGRSTLWATNWENADLIGIDPVRFTERCRIDLFELGIATPWGFEIVDDSIFISNVTYPILAELKLYSSPEACTATLVKKVDFHEIGYTPFTDGVYGFTINKERGRAYAVVGMLEGEYLLAIIELDLNDFSILREIRLPAGATLIPIPERNTLLAPSYYSDEIFEIDIEQMKVLRTIKAAPNILAIEYDANRGLLYTLSRAAGELLIINDLTGSVVHRIFVGRKPEPFIYDRQADRLYVGSQAGIMSINMGKLLKSVTYSRNLLEEFILNPHWQYKLYQKLN